MSSTVNKVTIFSNGIADFRRTFSAEKKAISIPVKKPHIGDVLASLNVHGPVKLTKPPSFIPENDTRGNLILDHSNLLCDMATKLVGARVKIERTSGEDVEGTLYGLIPIQQGTGGEAVTRYAMGLMTDAGLQNIPFDGITNTHFLDETIQSEVNRAVRRQFEKIKPLSTTVNLEVEPDIDPECEIPQTDFMIHYTVPAAAWKISYRLNCNTEDCSFDGFAIVDNNTEEDWDDFIVSVVTGEPITFGTDLAKAKIPSRNSVNVVADSAVGPVEGNLWFSPTGTVGAAGQTGPTGPTGGKGAEGSMGIGSVGKDNMVFKRKATARGLPDDENSLQQLASGDANMSMYYTEPGMEATAFSAETEIHEVGDFSIFESQNPISIGAGESATIPVFNVALNQNDQVLLYREKEYKQRPFRAIKFVNETDHSLGRGVCTVYDGGVYAGSCVLSPCKPGEEQILPHALETGVRVEKLDSIRSDDFMSLKISQRVGVTATKYTQTTSYRVTNSKDEEFKLIFDYDNLLCFNGERVVKVTLDDNEISVEKHQGSYRAVFPLPPNGGYSLVIEERVVVKTNVMLEGNRGVSWFDHNIISREMPIGDNPKLKEAIDLRKKIDGLEEQIEKAQGSREVAEEEQDRAIKLLDSDGTNDRWKKDLNTTEEEIRKIDRETLPGLKTEILEASEQFHDLLEAIAYEWVVT